MPNPIQFTYSCVVDRKLHSVEIEEWTRVLTDLNRPPVNQARVVIDRQWISYVFSVMEALDISIRAVDERIHKWYSPENLRLLLAKDAVNVLLKGKGSAFTSIGKGKKYVITLNELANALAQERNKPSVEDEYQLIELFLFGFEETIALTNKVIYISSDLSLDEVGRKLSVFSKLGFIKQENVGEYIVESQDTYFRLEERLDKLAHQQATRLTTTSHQFRYLTPIKPITDRPIAFVGLPFKLTDHFTAIDEACGDNGFLAYRIDRDPRFDTFLNKVMGAVLASKVCIFDVTDFNENVMLELGVAMSTNRDIVVVSEEASFVVAQEEWKTKVSEAVTTEDFKRLEEYLKDSKFINLVPSDVRERPVHLFKDVAELKAKLATALRQIG